MIATPAWTLALRVFSALPRLRKAQEGTAAKFLFIFRERLEGGIRPPLQRAFQLPDLLIGFDAQAPSLAFVPQFQQGVLQQRQCAGLMAHVLHE